MDTDDTGMQLAECETQTDAVIPFVTIPVAQCSKLKRFVPENAL